MKKMVLEDFGYEKKIYAVQLQQNDRVMISPSFWGFWYPTEANLEIYFV